VSRYAGERKVKSFSCLDQFLCMAFAQLTYRESLRDIEACLRAQRSKLYHLGIRSTVARNTLANANAVRDWRIYADFAQSLIAIARPLYVDEPFGVDLKESVYALDTTTIDLCLSLFPWARFSRSRGGVKLHTLFRLRGSFPTVVVLTAARVHDVNFLDQLSYEPGCFYIMDKAYVDFQRLCRLHQSGAFFVTRPFRSFRARRLYSRPVDKTSGVLFDQTVVLIHFYAHKAYSEPMRRVGFRDPQTGRKFIFLTNNFIEPALTIAQLYRCRWQVELFFKWIKQHLRIKAFYGLSENAVRTQIWIAMSVYLLVAIVKKRLHLDASLYTILQIASVTLFEKTPISQALSQQWPCPEQSNMQNQQCLPGF